MMGGVEAEVAGEEVVPAVRDVVRGVEVIRGRKSCVMVVRAPARADVNQDHRNDEHDRRVDRMVRKKRREQREIHEAHPDEAVLKLRMTPTDAPCAGITGERDGHRVFECAHRPAVFPRPTGLVEILIEIVQMVSQVVMEHPHIRRDAGMKRVDNLEKPIQGSVAKGRYVLMVMIPGGDEVLPHERDGRPGDEEWDALDMKINREVEDEEENDQRCGYSVCRVAKKTHGPVVVSGGISPRR